MRRSLYASCICCALMLSVSTPALAKLDKQTKAEVQTQVDELKASKDPQVLVPTLLAWGQIADRDGVKALKAFKTHTDPNVRLASGVALLNARDRSAQKFLLEQLRSSGTLYVSMRDIISLLDDKTELKLTNMLLKKAKPETKQAVVRYLAEQDGVRFAKVAQMLSGKSKEDRKEASTAIAAALNPEIKKYLPKLLTHKDESVRMSALNLGLRLAQQNEAHRADTIKLLERAITDKSVGVKQVASVELTKLNSAPALNTVLGLALAQKDEAKRQALVDVALEAALRGTKPAKSSTTPLIKAAKSPKARVSAYRLALLAGDTSSFSKSVDLLGSNTYDDRLVAAQILGYSKSDQASLLLTQTLFEGDRRMRLYSAQGLRVLAKPNALDALSKAVGQERDPIIKAEVIRALGAIGSKRAFNVLQFQATSSDPIIKMALLDALADIKQKEGFRTVEIILRDRNPKIKWKAFMTGLALDTDKAMQYKTQVLSTPPLGYMQELRDVLDDKSFNAMLTFLASNTDSALQSSAINYMLKRPENAFYAQLVRTRLNDTSTKVGVRRVILDRLAQSPTIENITAVEQAARDKTAPVVAHHASLVLAKLAGKPLEATFRGLSTTEDPVVKAFALYGLTQSLK